MQVFIIKTGNSNGNDQLLMDDMKKSGEIMKYESYH